MVEALQIAHVGVFALAAGSCLAALRRVRRFTCAEVRLGLYSLFVTAALWAGGQLVLFLNPPPAVARLAYYTALIGGLWTVPSWLYFCSAYTGQDYHRAKRYRRGVLAVFLSIVALKLTNPIHGQYFELQRAQAPFPHVYPALFDLHTAVEVFAYSAVAIGFFMFFQLFKRSEISTRGLAVLVSLTLVPLALDLLEELGVSALVANSYEPLGVAAFAFGTLFVADERFEEVRWSAETYLLDQINEGVLVVDESGVVRDFNASARELFPSVRAGCPLEAVDSSLTTDGGAETTLRDSRILSIGRDGERLYYLLNRTPLTIGPDMPASALVVSDITKVETQRRELKRQSEQLEGFSAAVAHELRNTLTIASSNVTLLSEALADDNAEGAEMLDRIRTANSRMIDIVDDLSMLARLGQTATVMETVRLSELVEAAGSQATAATVGADGTIRADRTRSRELVRNALELGSTVETDSLTIRVGDGTVTVDYSGPDLPTFDSRGFLAYGEAVPHAEAGMYGPNIQALARAQGWTVDVDQREDGFQIILRDVETEQS
jgi:signal transduction histidine kinase